jgi:ADP-ribose pyrophosphatase YjhB (NUDIX family)
VRVIYSAVCIVPGGGFEAGEAPWEAAVREVREETGLTVRLTNLTGVYVKPDRNQMAFNFTGEVVGGRLELGVEAAEFGHFRPGEEPVNTLPKQVERAADAARNPTQTLFKVQAGPPGLEVLGLARTQKN